MQAAVLRADETDNPDATTGPELVIRIGIHTGPVVAGVIGRQKFSYDLWGDTVNVASRMESNGIPGAIQVSEATYRRLRDRYAFEDRGMLDVKGKGRLAAYLLLGRNVSSEG
jgi:class 3 adenylate cyclase